MIYFIRMCLYSVQSVIAHKYVALICMWAQRKFLLLTSINNEGITTPVKIINHSWRGIYLYHFQAALIAATIGS